MKFNYPNGKPSTTYHGGKSAKKQATSNQRLASFSNRGMTFEHALNLSNDYYLKKGVAVVHKKPTPIQIVQVDYPKRSAAVIKEAYFREASTTDYNGVYRGHYLDFEAKETKNKTSFPLKNFHEHQIVHMKNCLAQRGLVFVLLWFASLHRCFFLDAKHLCHYWDCQADSRKSIPLKELEEIGLEVSVGYAPRIHYLSAIDSYYFKGE